MINIVKEIKINILNSIKFLVRIYRRSTMFAFSLALCIVCALFMKYFTGFEGFRLIILECSATVALTCIFLYIADFIKFVSNEIKNRSKKAKTYSHGIKVSVGIPEKNRTNSNNY